MEIKVKCLFLLFLILSLFIPSILSNPFYDNPSLNAITTTQTVTTTVNSTFTSTTYITTTITIT